MEKSALTLPTVLALYQKYENDLVRVRDEQRRFHVERGYWNDKRPDPFRQLQMGLRRVASFLRYGALLKPQLDDIEAEITYLRIRDLRPRTVVEVSPCGGWSTTWILRALRDNGSGHLYSYDLVDLSKKNVPPELAAGRWTFSQGDVTDNLSALPEEIDYLFIDSDHSESFALWYFEKLLPRLKAGTPVSIHDIFHTAAADGFSEEGRVVVEWLKQNRKDYFTASAAREPAHFNSISRFKARNGFGDAIHKDIFNSMVFFEA